MTIGAVLLGGVWSAEEHGAGHDEAGRAGDRTAGGNGERFAELRLNAPGVLTAVK